MDITSTLLVITVLVLTTILSIIGVEVFLILREFRESVRKINRILDDAGIISSSVAKPISGLADLATGLEGIVGLVKSFLKDKEKKTEEKKIGEEKEQKELSPENSSSRRFFVRAGKKLS